MIIGRRRVIGFITTIGSAWGLWTGVGLLGGSNGQANWPLALIWFSLFLWGLWCGINLIRHKTGRLVPAFAFWMLQIPFIQASFLRFSFSTGPVAIAAYHPDKGKVDLFLLLGSRLDLALMAPSSGFMIGINMFAVIIVFLLSMQLERTDVRPE